MFDMKQIGKKITNLRKTHNMTQMELADKLGISFQAVSNWERGNTMPDISKLPELAEIFHISVDELLNGKAPLVAAVLNDTVDEYMEEGNVTEEEIVDTLPLLKPEQVEEIVDKVNVSQFHDISSFLPFMDSDALAEIAMEYVEQGDSVDELLPFLDEEDVSKIAGIFMNNGDSISRCLPFMDEDDVANLAFDAMERNDSIDEFLPFMDEDDIAQIAYALLAKGDSASECLPFMDEDAVSELAIKALEKGDSIDEYLPFMDEDDVTQLALRILRSKKR